MTASALPAGLLRWRWTIYTLLALAYMLVFFHRVAPAVVAGELMAAFQTSGAALGSLAATYFYVYTLMQLPAGVLADTLGSRLAVTAGNLVAGCGSILFGLADSLSMAMTGRLLVGLGVSVVFVGLMKSNSVWFRERDYGRISGLTLTIGNLGAVLAAAPLAALLTVVSWRSVFLSIGGVSVLLAVLTLLLVRDKPQDCGYPSIRELDGLPPVAPRRHPWWKDLAGVLANRAIWPTFFVNLGMIGGFLAFVGLWAIPWLRDVHGIERGAASMYPTAALLGFAAGTLAFGVLSDRWQRRTPILRGGTLGYLLTLSVLLYGPWSDSRTGLALFALLGLSSASFAVSYACAKEICAPALAGMAVAVVNTGIFLGAALAQPLYGVVLDRLWQGELLAGQRLYDSLAHQQAGWLLLTLAAVAAVSAWQVPETYARQQHERR